MGRSDIKLSAGQLHGVNPFPRAWRAHAYAIDALPILNEAESPLATPVSEPGHEFLGQRLGVADQPITVLITGPVSNLAAVLAEEPALAGSIDEVVWMGGALKVPGNVRDYEHDGSAEWNAYWDPPATYNLWQAPAPLTLFPLDVTNNVPVTLEFLHRLARQRRFPLSDLAGQCWALTVGTIPAAEYLYHMWDTLTTGYLGAPELITLRQVRTEATPSGPGAGQIKEVAQGGRLVRAAAAVDVDKFFDYVLALFRR
jgi:purine nucleosidase